MQIDISKLYEMALDECSSLQRQVIELRVLYNETKKELDKLQNEKSE